MAVKRPQKISESTLSRLAERDREQFYALAAEYGLEPGPGKKIAYLIKRIMEESAGEDVSGGVKSERTVAPARRQQPKKAIRRNGELQSPEPGEITDALPQLLSAELDQNIELLRNFFVTLGKSLIEAAEALNR